MKKSHFHLLLIFLLVISPAFAGNNIIDLSGKWHFAIDRNDVGVKQKWFASTIHDDVINLPGSMVENLKGDDITLHTKFTASIYDSSWYYDPAMAKYRQPHHLEMPFWLTQLKHYVGLAWYQKEIDIPASWSNKDIQLFLEHPHFITRVWIDNKEIGSRNSLTTPHVFDLKNTIRKGKHLLTVRIDNRLNHIDVGRDSHSVTDHTQGNWNGMVGKLELIALPKVHFDNIQIYPDLKNRTALVKITIGNMSHRATKGTITLSATSFNSAKTDTVAPISFKYEIKGSEKDVQYIIHFDKGMLTWDEFNPALYHLHAEISTKHQSETKNVEFGMREITIKGKYFYINGRKIALRGTVENAVFPLTGYPPMDEPSWERVFRICKSYGLNHMRFHSYCPPMAAFEAADKMGFYLQVEGPSWPNHSTMIGRGYPIDTYLMNETKRMDKVYGNFPSFTFMAAGNEPRGNWVPWATKFVDYWKATDKRHVYTGFSVGGSWAWQPAAQYHVKAGARGLNWRTTEPETMSDFRAKIDTVREPYVSHETGQWCAFPDFDEIVKFTGVTRAKNFELFRENLADHDMANMAHLFLMASGKLQALCYKHEIEKNLRTPGYAGFQLLSLNDYPGQGTALVGVLDFFWDTKGYMTANKFRHFCNSTVPLIRTKKFVYRNNEHLKAEVEVYHFGEAPLKNAVTEWRLRDRYGLVLKKGIVSTKNIPIGNDFSLGNVDLDLSSYKYPVKLNLQIAIAGTPYSNNWDFWVYPAKLPQVSTKGIYITNELDQKAVQTLHDGGKVLILAAGKIEYGKNIIQYYQPVFWNTSWFKMRPPHTTGAFIVKTHPVFNHFVTGSWGNMQWWELLNQAEPMLLTEFPKGFQPIVQPIDTWFKNRKLGMLFEAKVGSGKLMMTSCDLQNDLQDRPVAQQLYYSIIKYMQSSKFRPATEVPLKTISDLFTKKEPKANFFTKNSPDELKKGVK